MPFRPKNAYYLRISAKDILPLYLFLDDGHLDWMSDRILQHVLADLRPKILPKIKVEARVLLGSGEKQGTVDVHRGDTYQFAFFFRKTEPHAVLIKNRTFIQPPQKNVAASVRTLPPDTRVRKRRGQNAARDVNVRKKRRTKGKGRQRDIEELVSSSDDELDDHDDTPVSLPTSAPVVRRSARRRTLVAGGYSQLSDEEGDASSGSGDIEFITSTRPEIPSGDNVASGAVTVKAEMQDIGLESSDIEIQPAPAQEIEIDAEDEDDQAKPLLQLRYDGFNIYGHCLCVVVEPWPSIRSGARVPPKASLQSSEAGRTLRTPPADYSAERGGRETTPLFLPESDRGRSETPAPFQIQERRVLPPVPLFEAEDEDEAEANLMEFSQVLNSRGDFQPGADDDDEMDGAVFFGDADEAREL